MQKCAIVVGMRVDGKGGVVRGDNVVNVCCLW